ncbi:MAG: formylglycine-generating enzyme family protein [Magnetococcales bacterium]|nr:formylglycine-generating enzyme family protein [Magnetococcales bacterium]
MALSLVLCSGILWADPAKTDTNSIGVEFVVVPAGTFMMGSPFDPNVFDDEIPQHKVTISKPFSLGKYKVTQAQWEAVMGNNPSDFKGENQPVDSVSWEDVQLFIRRLNIKEGTKAYRLPTEAEWEYAARAGTTTSFYWGESESEINQYAWNKNNSGMQTHPVGQKKPNAFGLYDMSGNVWDWVQDWYDVKYYDNSPETDPSGPSAGSKRVARGGGYGLELIYLRSAVRDDSDPGHRSNRLGFRLCKTSL